jgi:type VI secretion system protein ImpH
MAEDGGRQSASLKRLLFDDASRFTFLQAVRLLERIRHDATPPGEGVNPRQEVVLFRHGGGFDFPNGDVEEIDETAGPQPRMTVNILGLTGAVGPLPHHVTQQVLERTLRGDRATRDFLDIFNHRLISLLYRARKKYRPALDRRGPQRGRVATVLYALMGLGARSLQNRMPIPDRTLLPYAGLLASANRSAAGLERIVEDCFAVPAKIVPFEGRWHELEEDEQTSIGVSGRNQVLGQDAVLGGKVWDQNASFEIRLGPLPVGRFRSFLPTGDAFAPLVALVRYYIGEELGFTFRLLVEKERVTGPSLRGRLFASPSRNGGEYLGWTSWLSGPPAESVDEQVTFVGRR